MDRFLKLRSDMIQRAYGYAERLRRIVAGPPAPAAQPAAAAEPSPPPPAPPAPHASLTRVEKALLALDPKGLGLEIGPSFRPIAPKAGGFNVETVDHASAAELREKYAKEEGVDVSQIEEVDYIWRGEPLDELVGSAPKYDWIIASHVIEHVPDLLSFLQQCERLLKSKGILSLVIPDKRYCFDYFRWPSTTGDVLQAWAEQRRRHLPGVVFDCVAHIVKRDGLICWGPATRGEITFLRGFDEALPIFEQARSSTGYIDVHGWRFTPASFRLILTELKLLGLLKLALVRSFPTAGCEFFAMLEPNEAQASKADRLPLHQEMMREVAEAIDR